MRKILQLLLTLLWPAYMKTGNVHPLSLVFKYWVIQKIFRINSHVQWPVHFTSKVMCPNKIVRGKRTPGLGVCCHIDGRNGIIFGENVWIGPRVSIISMNHNVNNFADYIETGPVVIGDNCWLATNCIILPGVKLGEHTVVGAGAVVTKSFPQGNALLGGVPAKIVKQLDTYGT